MKAIIPAFLSFFALSVAATGERKQVDMPPPMAMHAEAMDDLIAPTVNIDVSGRNLAEICSKNEVLLVFTTESCPACVRIKPHIREFGKWAKTNKPDLIIAELNAMRHQDLLMQFKVHYVPTLKHILKGDVYSPDDVRTVNALQTYFMEEGHKRFTATKERFASGPFSKWRVVLSMIGKLSGLLYLAYVFLAESVGPWVLLGAMGGLSIGVLVLMLLLSKERKFVTGVKEAEADANKAAGSKGSKSAQAKKRD